MSRTSGRVGRQQMMSIFVILAVTALGMPAAAFAAVKVPAPVSPQKLALIERVAQHMPATVAAATARGGAVNGSFKLNRFERRQGQLVALGTFRGTVADPRLGARAAQVSQPVTIPLDQVRRAAVAPKPLCKVGMIKLNGTLVIELVGIRLTLRSLQLDIGADPGSLLGSILCALARGPAAPPAPPTPPLP